MKLCEWCGVGDDDFGKVVTTCNGDLHMSCALDEVERCPECGAELPDDGMCGCDVDETHADDQHCNNN